MTSTDSGTDVGRAGPTWLPDPLRAGLRSALDDDADPATASGYVDHPPRVGFFTDTSVCIGCKACEVACKEWNRVPEDGLMLTGMSYDNTGGLSADSGTWRSSSSASTLIQVTARMAARGGGAGGDLPLADVVRRVQALHARRMPGRLSDRRAVPNRVRHCRGSGGRRRTDAATAFRRVHTA